VGDEERGRPRTLYNWVVSNPPGKSARSGILIEIKNLSENISVCSGVRNECLVAGKISEAGRCANKTSIRSGGMYGVGAGVRE